MATKPNQPTCVIIGAGFSGLCMGIKLKDAGFHDFTILEKGDDVGGVWCKNTYPGACCDVPANLYSYSFDMKTDWSRRYPLQPEINAYQRDVATRYELYPHCRFNAEVESTVWDDDTAKWTVTTKDGQMLIADFVMSGVGQLDRPAWPEVSGMETFEGEVLHSAQWNPEFDATDRNIAVIGTGASAIQFIPRIAENAKRVEILQRTPPYILPKMDHEYNAFHRFLFRRIPGFQRLYRHAWWKFGEIMVHAFDHVGSITGRILKFVALAHMRKHVKDPELREKLTPDYPIGCKRVLFAANYFEALAQDNVDVITEALERVESDGVVTTTGRKIVADTIVYGTGFKATDFLQPMKIVGAKGLDLREAWRDGAEAYRGVSVPGFPNFFMMYGPNTNLGSNSIIFMIECQVGYIMSCIQQMQARNLTTVDVREDLHQAYNDDVQERLSGSVWSAGCSSWYHNAAGKVTNNWPGNTANYRRMMATFSLDDYHAIPAQSG